MRPRAPIVLAPIVLAPVVLAMGLGVSPMLALALGACDNALVGTITPVPPVHRVPIEIEGKVILLAEDAVIESSDPVHQQRARDHQIPHDLRVAMTEALKLAGFRVVDAKTAQYDLVAKVALAVREEKNKVYQTYRCGLRGADGTEVAQIDWAWPPGVYVDENAVLEYAAHNVATEIATSRRVTTYLAALRSP